MTERNNYALMAMHFAKKHMPSGDPSHDMFHINRVIEIAKKIGESEQLSEEELEDLLIIVYLHEFADEKIFETPERGIELARIFILEINKNSEELLSVIKLIGYRKRKTRDVSNLSKKQLLLLHIAEDADLLDSTGAVGFARVCAYSGKTGRPLDDPNANISSVYTGKSESMVAHCQEKLLKFSPSDMHTALGKEMIRDRIIVMREIYDIFMKESRGNS